LADLNRNDPIDRILDVIPASLRGLSAAATSTQNGNLRWYAAVAGAGLCLLLGLVAFT
jgi:NADH-quinone oxidoreductase subunit L